MFNLSKIFVTFFYIGYSKYAPGTVGTFFSFFLLFFLNLLIHKIFFYLIFIICLLLSIYFITCYIKITNKNDPSEIIIDEFLGVFIIFFFVDYIKEFNIYILLILSFIFFRFFDILKPFPINWIDKKFNNAFGIICDDMVSGIYTILIILIINGLI